MNPRTVLIIFLAIVSAGSAAAGIYILRSQGLGATSHSTETVPVVLATEDIPRGSTIISELIKVREYPKELVPAGAITQREDALDRAVLTPLSNGEPLLETKLAAKGAGRGLEALIPDGMRGFTIETPKVSSAVAGFIMPSAKVDVLLTVSSTNPIDPSGGASTTTLLQNVEILTVDQRVVPTADNKVDLKELRSVTLLVTPDQAAKLALGQNKGTLQLSLRSRKDDKAADTRPATLADLKFHQERPVAPRHRDGDVPKIAGQFDTLQLAERSPSPGVIRTLRGTREGSVLVQPVGR